MIIIESGIAPSVGDIQHFLEKWHHELYEQQLTRARAKEHALQGLMLVGVAGIVAQQTYQVFDMPHYALGIALLIIPALLMVFRALALYLGASEPALGVIGERLIYVSNETVCEFMALNHKEPIRTYIASIEAQGRAPLLAELDAMIALYEQQNQGVAQHDQDK